MSKFTNIWKPTPEKFEQGLLGLKALLTGLAVSATAQENPNLGFYLLLFGGFVDIAIRMFFNKKDESDTTE